MTIAGIVVTTIGALILALPLWKSEEVRMGRLVKPRGKGKDDAVQINKAIQRIGTPCFWTDKKIYILGFIVMLVGTLFLILGV